MSTYYTDSVSQPRRESARHFDGSARRAVELAAAPRVGLYEKEPISLPRLYPDSDRETRIVNRRPNRTRDSSSDSDYERTPRRKPLVIRPRSMSRVQLVEPASVTGDSSSDEEPRRHRRGRDDDTHIRATSRPGKKKEYALVRKPSRSRRKSDARAPVVHDLEFKTKPQHKTFQSRRDNLENTEALVLVRARSREREGLVDESSDEDVYSGRRRRSHYGRHSRRERGSIDDGQRELVIARDDRDREGRKSSTRGPELYSYGKGLILADGVILRSDRGIPGRRRQSLSPDLESVDSNRAGEGLRRASTVISRAQKPRSSRAYDDRLIEPERRVDPRRDSAYYTDAERRAKNREREAIEREKRAIEREKAALDREQLLVDRERRASARDVPEERKVSAADYLKQGDQHIKDGQKYYRTGQGVVSGVKNLLK